VLYANNVAPTITSSGPPYSRTGNQHSEVDALVVHGSQDPIVSDKAHAIGRNQGQENVLAYGVKTAHTTSNGWGIQEEKTHTLDRTGTTPAVFDKTNVRRLTPVEAERLQGFPDGHTDIGWKGKPTPDSHRYKAMGNSMAVPVMRWIGKRIQMVEEKNA
jgi:DNA (cytosine-5)-methyltransferase 1